MEINCFVIRVHSHSFFVLEDGIGSLLVCLHLAIHSQRLVYLMPNFKFYHWILVRWSPKAIQIHFQVLWVTPDLQRKLRPSSSHRASILPGGDWPPNQITSAEMESFPREAIPDSTVSSFIRPFSQLLGPRIPF